MYENLGTATDLGSDLDPWTQIRFGGTGTFFFTHRIRIHIKLANPDPRLIKISKHESMDSRDRFILKNYKFDLC